MKYEHKNFARTQPVFEDGDVIEKCNLSQAARHTGLTKAAGKRVVFRGCNLVNVTIDPAWKINPPPASLEFLGVDAPNKVTPKHRTALTGEQRADLREWELGTCNTAQVDLPEPPTEAEELEMRRDSIESEIDELQGQLAELGEAK